jgi:hypothetical protein
MIIENSEINILHGRMHREWFRNTLAAARNDLLTGALRQIANAN